ncbi:MAG: hypothetical protein AB7O91_12160 [Sphingomonas sp.]
MASRLVDQESGGAGALIAACVAESGSGAHPYFTGGPLAGGPHAVRNVADAVHFLCVLHGRHPGIVDLAAGRVTEPAARAWLVEAGAAMAEERRLLARIAVAAGGAPSTPGHAASEATVAAQRAALHTLAQSDRAGCALGAALAFALDWRPVRALLDVAAARLGIDAPAFRLGDPDELRLVADVAGENALVERALLFGASQLAHQHRGLWDLLEAREQARRDG